MRDTERGVGVTLPGYSAGQCSLGKRAGRGTGCEAERSRLGFRRQTELGGSCWDSTGGAQLEGTRKEGRVSFDLSASIIR